MSDSDPEDTIDALENSIDRAVENRESDDSGRNIPTTYTADETCMNCQSENIESVYTEEGQFKGTWCNNCGVINRPNGLFTSPNRNAAPIAELEQLADEWDKRTTSIRDTPRDSNALGEIDLCRRELRELIADYTDE